MSTKIERYDWALPGDDGQFRCVPVHELKVDHSYQREQVSDSTILKIARDFSWSMFGVLIVMERTNGNLYVVDGQQRLAACIRRGDIEKAPCYVFKSDGKDHEARAFLGLNTARTKVSAVDKFNAAARANLQPMREISSWLGVRNLRVTKNGNISDGIAFPAKLVETWDKNADDAKEAILIQREISPGQPLVSPIHLGIAYLLNAGIPVRDEIHKIISEGGKERLLGAIRNEMHLNNANDSTLVCARGVLAVINFRRKTRKYSLAREVQ
jgi:hypothetical protein